MRHLRHQIGGSRGNDDEIGFARNTNVSDVELDRRVKQVGMNALPRKRASREGSNEFLRCLSQYAAHGNAALLEPTNEIERFVCRYPTADDEENALRLLAGVLCTQLRLLQDRLRRPCTANRRHMHLVRSETPRRMIRASPPWSAHGGRRASAGAALPPRRGGGW